MEEQKTIEKPIDPFKNGKETKKCLECGIQIDSQYNKCYGCKKVDEHKSTKDSMYRSVVLKSMNGFLALRDLTDGEIAKRFELLYQLLKGNK